MRLFATLSLILSGLVSAHAADSRLGRQAVGMDELAPLQMEAGFAEVRAKAEEWIAEAREKSSQKGKPIRKYLVKILNREGDRDFPAYISPDGMFRPNDGHHKILAANSIIERYRLDPSEIEWRVDVQADFEGKSWESFAREMKRLKVGYFPPEVLAESKRLGETPGQLFRRLPADFSAIEDWPMRSAVGALFDSMELKGSWFAPYSQFYLGELFARYGVRVPQGEELSAKVADALNYMLWIGPQRDKIQGKLRSMITKKKDKIAERLDEARKAALARKKSLKPGRRYLTSCPEASLRAQVSRRGR